MRYGMMLAFTHLSAWSQLTVEADRLGIESVWLPDHLVVPDEMVGNLYPDGEPSPLRSDTPLIDCPVHLAHLAAQTERIKLGTHVYVYALRHPLVAARAFTSVDDLSGGRLLLGVGAGWLASEFAVAGVDFASRGRRLDEAIDVTRRLWSEQVVEHRGEFWQWDPVWFEPKPPQAPAGPPIIVGGESGPALRRAATRGDGWVSMPHDRLETVEPVLARLRDLCADRDPALGRLEISITCPEPPPAAEIPAWEAAGVDRLLVRPWKRTSGASRGLHDFAEHYL